MPLEQFDEAVAEAKAEGNLSRANVVRKVKPQDRWEKVVDMARQGYSSRQIARAVDMNEQSLRRLARERGVDIHADKVVGRTRRIDSTDVARRTVLGLQITAETLGVDETRELAEQLLTAAAWVEAHQG